MNLAEEFPDCTLWADLRGWSIVCHGQGGSIEMTAVWGGEHRAEICRELAPRQPIPWPWGMGSTHDVVEICRAARRLADEYLGTTSGKPD
jgi:hypothetical protein